MRWQAAAAGFAALWLLAGCAGASERASEKSSAPASGTTGAAAQTAQHSASGPSPSPGPPSGTTDRQTMERVIREWSRRLDAGDNAGAARLFALPAIIAQAGAVGRFETYAQLAEWHAALPCSGIVDTITFETDSAVAVFVLGNRLTSKCDAVPGTKAAARFSFRNGQIVAWEQIPVPGGGSGGGSTGPVV